MNALALLLSTALLVTVPNTATPVRYHHVLAPQRPAAEPAFGAGQIRERDGSPVFYVDGKPFFVYGAAFFYERLPRATWRTALCELKYGLGINTLDLYVPWNWHELHDGDFDFTGRTNPRRDLREVVRLARRFGFKLILRPGPVIRNEWRNGGYPAWLLERPEYGMPLRDRLEGRYPPTATLQNAHSDDAAAQWLHNATHLRYTERWLRRALAVFRPDADLVIAVALDDDQGAYIDNQTWPAPHLRTYLQWLRGVVRASVGPRVPTFINTYQMKVTASSPVWAMGNWYQSAAYILGEHDLAQLQFSTGLLQTRPHQPLMASEFQAGWLQQPQDILPQAAAPANTLLAMDTMIGMGVRGIVNFPAQDTMYPAGWEVPFANAFYAWDAALGYDAATSHPVATTPSRWPFSAGFTPRGGPTRTVGSLITTFGPMLAAAHVLPDAAIAYLTSAYPAAHMSNADVAAVAQRTMIAQRSCRRLALTCELVDLRYIDRATLRRFAMLIVPYPNTAPLRTRPFVDSVRATLTSYRRLGRTSILDGAEPSIRDVAAALARARARRVVEGAPGASFALDERTGAGFVTLVNDTDRSQAYPRVTVRPPLRPATVLPQTVLRAHSAAVLPVDIPLHALDSRFDEQDRFTSSCAVIRVARSRTVARFTLDATATERCGLKARFAGRSYALSVPADVADVELHVGGGASLVPSSPTGLLLGASSGSTQRTLPVRNGLLVEEPPSPRVVADSAARAYREDVYRDGQGAIVLENDWVRIIASPAAGGRAFVFEDKARRTNAFTTVGALRDDVLIEPPLSTSDRIAKFTDQMPAGTFNRPYRASIVPAGHVARVRLAYDAPDTYPHGAHFERTLKLAPHTRCLAADLQSRFDGKDALTRSQRAVSVSSLTVGDPRVPDARLIMLNQRHMPVGGFSVGLFAARSLGAANVTGLFDPRTHALVLEAWSGDPEPAVLIGRGNSLIVRVPQRHDGTSHIAFDFEPVGSYAQAVRRADLFARKQGQCPDQST